MEGILLIAWLGIAGLAATLVGLCIKLPVDSTTAGTDHASPHGPEALAERIAAGGRL
jgi:hypothetical protein